MEASGSAKRESVVYNMPENEKEGLLKAIFYPFRFAW